MQMPPIMYGTAWKKERTEELVVQAVFRVGAKEGVKGHMLAVLHAPHMLAVHVRQIKNCSVRATDASSLREMGNNPSVEYRESEGGEPIASYVKEVRSAGW
jgi:hypothetical protein